MGVVGCFVVEPAESTGHAECIREVIRKLTVYRYFLIFDGALVIEIDFRQLRVKSRPEATVYAASCAYDITCIAAGSVELLHARVIAQLPDIRFLIHIEPTDEPVDVAIVVVRNEAQFLNKHLIVIATLCALCRPRPLTTVQQPVPVVAVSGPQSAIVTCPFADVIQH